MVGRRLTQMLRDKGYEVIWLSRERHVRAEIPRYKWDYRIGEIDEEAVERADAVVHLAGANIGDERWSESRKKTIVESRVQTARLLFDTLQKQNKKIDAWVSASAVGYYGIEPDERVFTEDDHVEAPDFLASTCRKWEATALDFHRSSGTRTVVVRTGFVVSQNSEAYQKLAFPTRLGLGSPIGSGRQYMSWVHLDDLCGIYLQAIEDTALNGIYNAVAPEFITNTDFMRALARSLKRPFFMPKVPKFVMRMVMGEAADMILYGNRISGEKILNAGYQFKFERARDVFAGLHKDVHKE